MYGGYAGSYNLSDYAPSDPITQIPGLGNFATPPAVVQQPPQPAPPQGAQPQASTAPSTSARPVNRSQSTNDSRPGNNPSRVTTAEYRKDFAQAAPYVPTPINENAAAGRAPPTQPTPAPPPYRPSNANQEPPRAAVNVKKETPSTSAAPVVSERPHEPVRAPQPQARGNNQQGAPSQEERQRRMIEINNLHERLAQPPANQQHGRIPAQVMQLQNGSQQMAQQQQMQMQNMMHRANGNPNVRPGIPAQLGPTQRMPSLISPEEAQNMNVVMRLLELPSNSNPMPPHFVRYKGRPVPVEEMIKSFYSAGLPVPGSLSQVLPEGHPLHPSRRIHGPQGPGYQLSPANEHLRMMHMMRHNIANRPGNQPPQMGQLQAGRPDQNPQNAPRANGGGPMPRQMVPGNMAPGMGSPTFNMHPGMIPPNINPEQRQQILNQLLQQAQQKHRQGPQNQRVPPQFARVPALPPNHHMMQQQQQQAMRPPMNMAPPQNRPVQQSGPSQPGPSEPPRAMRPLTHAQQMMERSQRNPGVQVNPLAEPPVSSFTPAPQPASPLLAQPEPVDVKPIIRTPQAKPDKNQRPAVVTVTDEPPRVQVKREAPEEQVSSSSPGVSSSSAPQKVVRVKQEPIDVEAESTPPRNLSSVESEIIRRQTIAKCEKMKKREIEDLERRHKEEFDRRIDARVEEMLKARLDEELQKRLSLLMETRNLQEGESTSSALATPAPNFDEFEAPEVVQESQVTTTDDKRMPKSRSSSVGSELAIRPSKKKVIKCSDSDDEAEKKDRSEKHTRRSPTPTRKVRKVIIEDSDDDDDMPMLSRKRNRRADSDEEYQMEEEADDRGDSEMEDFINDDEVDELEDDDSMKDFVVDDEEVEAPVPKKRPVARPVSRDSPRRTTRSSSRAEDAHKKAKNEPASRSRKNRKSPEPESKKIKTYEDIEAAKKSKRLKTMATKEENRLKKHKANLTAMECVGIERVEGRGLRATRPSYDSGPPTPTTEDLTKTIRKLNKSNDKKGPQKPQRVDERRRTEGSSTNKRPTTSTAKDDDDDSDGVHVPAKRMAHSSSAPKPSNPKMEGPSAAQLGRKRPNQSAMFEKRQNEADEARNKMKEEYQKLKSKKYPTEQEQLKIRALAKKLSLATRSAPLIAHPSCSSSSSTSNPAVRKVTIKKEMPYSPEKIRQPPKILKPHVGSAFARIRKEAITNIFKHLLETDADNPESDAQRFELEVAEKARDSKSYSVSLAHKILQIKRKASSGIVAVNKNAVSHQQILAGGAKENCTVGSNRRQQTRPELLPIDELHPLLVPLKLTSSELQKNAYPLFSNGSKTAEIAETTYTVNKKMFLEDYDLVRTCSRCNKEFRLNPDGTMIRQKDICRYHNRGIVRDGKKQTFSKRYPCCNEEFNSTPGCKFSDVHVFDQLFKKELKKFVTTPQPSSPGDPRSVKAYALDCEFVYTVDGPALARLTMVDMKNVKVLDVFIKPPSEVLDPNTEFSGLTMDQIETATDTMKTCHEKLFNLVNSETILIGHSLESDLKAMRIVHMSVIDTAILFSKGDFKTALRTLSSKFLHKNIQADNEDALGHDSLEDAQACVDLIFYGLKNPESLGMRPTS